MHRGPCTPARARTRARRADGPLARATSAATSAHAACRSWHDSGPGCGSDGGASGVTIAAIAAIAARCDGAGGDTLCLRDQCRAQLLLQRRVLVEVRHRLVATLADLGPFVRVPGAAL